MADPVSGDGSARQSSGAIEGQQESSTSTSLEPESDTDQTLADADQTLADADQTLSDDEQTRSDSDQSAADSDQEAADRDQAASDRDLALGGSAGLHDETRDVRDRSAHHRRKNSEARVRGAAARDAAAAARDAAARARDQLAEVRDRMRAARDIRAADDGRAGAGAELLSRARRHRERAAADRVVAAEARAQAARDREEAAADREHAAADREQARADRRALLAQLSLAETDALTGTRTRQAGLVDLDREIARARRTTAGLLVVAYLDVVGLKIVNDTQGHAAGDQLLMRVTQALRCHLRSYDIVVRLGGDEFLCVMSGATMHAAQRRFDAVHAALAQPRPFACEITVGFAALEPEDGAAELIDRADVELLRHRSRISARKSGAREPRGRR